MKNRPVLQILQNEIRQLGVQLVAGVAAINGVVFVGIEELLVLFFGLVELRYEVHGVLEVYVVVGGAVDEQVVAL